MIQRGVKTSSRELKILIVLRRIIDLSICNLAERIRCVERVMANEFPDEVSYQEMIECLWEDLKLAQKQIQYTYGKVLK